MLNRVFIDGNWIANGYFFKRCQEITPKPFMETFNEWESQTEEVKLVGANTVKVSGMDCVLFGNGKGCYLVQDQYLLEIGFDLMEDDADDFEFRLNKEHNMLFVYDEDNELLGGLMLVKIPNLPEPEELERELEEM